MDIDETVCATKRRYRTADDARAYIDQHPSHRARQVYPCYVCGNWHTTKSKQRWPFEHVR